MLKDMSTCGMAGPVSAEFDVFISHAGPDKQKYVLPLVAALERKGVTFWLDERNLSIGDSLTMGINEGLRRSRYVLVCLSQSFLGRAWPEAEMSAAMALQNRLGQKRLLPVVFDSPDEIFQRYPLLADKLYVAGTDLARVAETVFDLLTGPEDILRRPDLVIDAEVSDHLVLQSKRGTSALEIENFLVNALERCSDDANRHWIYYTLGRVGGSRAYSLLQQALLSESGISLKGVKGALRYFN